MPPKKLARVSLAAMAMAKPAIPAEANTAVTEKPKYAAAYQRSTNSITRVRTRRLSLTRLLSMLLVCKRGDDVMPFTRILPNMMMATPAKIKKHDCKPILVIKSGSPVMFNWMSMKISTPQARAMPLVGKRSLPKRQGEACLLSKALRRNSHP